MSLMEWRASRASQSGYRTFRSTTYMYYNPFAVHTLIVMYLHIDCLSLWVMDNTSEVVSGDARYMLCALTLYETWKDKVLLAVTLCTYNVM